MRIIFATKNPGKIVEIQRIMADFGLTVQTMTEAGFNPEIIEDGTTFTENALKKVRAIGPQADAIIMSDDSGISIDALGGAPGILSARYMGEDTPYTVKNAAIIEKLSGKEGAERGAHYTCVIAMILPDGREFTAEGKMFGEIAKAPAGENGFGYDPIFFLPEYGKTTGELPKEVKNSISHRHIALEQAKAILKKELFS